MASDSRQQRGRAEGGHGEQDDELEEDGNVGRVPDGGDGWTRDEMERAEPYPMPEIPDEEPQDESQD